MKKIFVLLALLFCAGVHAQQQQIYCNKNAQTPCNTSSDPGNGFIGDPAWKAFGKVNANESSLFGRTPVPADYGAKGDCSTNDTTAMQSFFNGGSGYVSIPSGGCYKVTNSVKIPSNSSFTGAGPAALIKLVLAGGSPAVPVLDLSGSGQTTTTGISLGNFAVDGGNAAGLSAPVVYSGNKSAGAGILVQSANTTITNVTVSNAWDNGIAVGQPSGSTTTNSAAPSFVTVSGIQCLHNGYGSGGGACFDNLAGAQVTLSHSIDFQSEFGFIVDFGSGAVSAYSNLMAKASNRSGYYIGSPNTTLVNLQSNFANQAGMWIDIFAAGGGSSLTNFTSENATQQGLLLMAGQWQITNVVVKNASTGNPGTYDDILVQNPGYQTQNISQLSIIGASSTGSNHRYGYNESPGGTYTISAALTGITNLTGGNAAIAPSTASGGIGVTYQISAAEISASITPTNNIYPPGDVRRYGADPTGVSDSTTAIQSALNASAYAQTVIFPAGKFKFTSTLSVPTSGYAQVTGAGQYKTFLIYAGASTTADLFDLFGPTALFELNTSYVRDLTLLSTTNMTAGACIHVKWGGFVIIQNVGCGYQFQGNAGFSNFLWNGFWFESPGYQRLEGFESVVKNDGIDISAGGVASPPQYDVWVNGGKITGATIGVHVGGGVDNIYFDRMMVTNNGTNVVIDNALASFKNQEVSFGSQFVTDQATSGPDYLINDPLANNTNYCQISIRGPVTHSNTSDGIKVQNWPNCWVNIFSPYIIFNNQHGIEVDDSSAHVMVGEQTNIGGNGGYGIFASSSTQAIISLANMSGGNTSGSINSNVISLAQFTGPITINGNFFVNQGTIQLSNSYTTSTLPGCTAGQLGLVAVVTDSTTQTWGATYSGGNTLKALLFCDGSNWTVMAK